MRDTSLHRPSQNRAGTHRNNGIECMTDTTYAPNPVFGLRWSMVTQVSTHRVIGRSKDIEFLTIWTCRSLESVVTHFILCVITNMVYLATPVRQCSTFRAAARMAPPPRRARPQAIPLNHAAQLISQISEAGDVEAPPYVIFAVYDSVQYRMPHGVRRAGAGPFEFLHCKLGQMKERT